jgi:DNA invertase Pin-like site-specific DNA recombinase
MVFARSSKTPAGSRATCLLKSLCIVTLITRGVRVFAGNGDELTTTDDRMRKAMRQIVGVFAELEKSRLVAKLRAARQRKRERAVKGEGRGT